MSLFKIIRAAKHSIYCMHNFNKFVIILKHIRTLQNESTLPNIICVPRKKSLHYASKNSYKFERKVRYFKKRI